MVNDSPDAIISALKDLRAFKADNTSVTWEIQNAQVKVDLLTIDNELNNSYAERLLSGKSLPINFTSYVSQVQSRSSTDNGGNVTGPKKVRLNITRALSRLKS